MFVCVCVHCNEQMFAVETIRMLARKTRDNFDDDGNDDGNDNDDPTV